MIKTLLPDPNSWLIDSLFNFFKLIKNDFDISLFEALSEYVEQYAHECAYLGPEVASKLHLYAQLDYQADNRCAKLERTYFLSKKAKFLKTWNYCKYYSDIGEKQFIKKFGDILPEEFESKWPGLQFFASYNNLDIYTAKDILLKYSYHRESLKKLIVIENEASNFDSNSVKLAVITFDLSFLDEIGLFKVAKYESFRQLLPHNFVIELPLQIDVDMQEVPSKLKEEQLINLYKLS